MGSGCCVAQDTETEAPKSSQKKQLESQQRNMSFNTNAMPAEQEDDFIPVSDF